MSKQQKKSTTITPASTKLKRRRNVLFGAFLIIVALLLFLAIISYFTNWQDDFSTLENFTNPEVESQNILKKLGAYISHFLVYQLFGLGAFLLTYLILITGLSYFLNFSRRSLLRQWSWGILHTLWISVCMGFFYEFNPILSGVVGYETFILMSSYVGTIGLASLLTCLLYTSRAHET